MSRDFYELCYDQYKHEMSETDNLYQKAGVMLVVIPLLGTLMVTLGRLNILNLCFIRIDVFLFYLAFLIASVTLVTSMVFLFLCVCPRQYKTLADMDVWQKWIKKYQEHLNNKEQSAEDRTSAELDAAMFENLCPKLAEAQSINAEINEKRRKAFKRAIQMAAIALVAVGTQAIFSIILQIQGV